jgi:GGDEF domain-containing protein
MRSKENTPSPNAQSGSIILDNATLRGALIALGIIDPPHAMDEPSIKVLDSYVACAELLIESILLHDHIYLPKIHAKGYPDVFHKMQSAVSGNIFIELPFTEQEIKDITQFAYEDFAAWPQAEDKLRKRLREFAGIEVPIASWDRWIQSRYNSASSYKTWETHLHSISDYYVTRVDTSLADHVYPWSQHLKHSLSDEIEESERIEAAILWLTSRTCVYDCIAWVARIPYVPHPQRASLWKAINIRRSQPDVFNKLPYDVLFDARVAVGTRLHETFGKTVGKTVGTQLFDLSIPPFFTYVLSKSNSSSDILNVALDMRNNRGVRKLRNILNEISENLYQEKSILEIQKLINDFEKLKKQITQKYYAASAPKITPTLQVAGTFGAEFDITMPVWLLEIAAKFQSINKPHLALLRDVFNTTINVWKLSHQYDRLFLGRRTLLQSTVAPPRVITSPPDHAVPDEWGNWYVTEKVRDPEYDAPIDCRKKLDEFLSSGHDCKSFLAIIDIDNMDLFYNTYGRGIGDLVIHHVALALRDIEVELLSKVAGDTFIVIKFNGLATLESQIKNAVRNIPFYIKKESSSKFSCFVSRTPSEYGGQYERIPIFVSVGSAMSPNDGASADALFKIAYHKLKEEKIRKSQEKTDEKTIE